jgi:uncharacterized protein
VTVALKITESVSLPNDAVTQTMACIGRKGAGKTYLASLLAEQMLTIRAQVVIIDPVGNWFGLRVAADGKGKGKDIFIAGGSHGDVPILPETGARFARLIVEKNISIILDVSGFRQGERKRFAADFAEEFFHLKKAQRSAVHLFVEEAQLFAPQRTGPEEARMLGAFENIIRLGRNYGIGATMISQRPQSINKEVLSQVECLCVLQVNGTHERKALEEWVQEAGADRKLVGELPGLSRGEGYIWSPSWLRVFERVRFGTKTTFDASATPEVGKTARAAMLSTVDVEALKTDLQEVIANAERDDPKALRREIAELKKNLHAKPVVSQAMTVPKAEMEALKSENIALAKQVEGYVQLIEKVGAMVSASIEHGEAMQVAIGTMKVIVGNQPKQITPRMKRENEWAKAHQPLAPVRQKESKNQAGELTGPEQRVLNAIAWLEDIGVESPEQPAVAFLAGYSYGGGAYNNPRGRLNVAGMVEYVAGNRIRLTESGKRVAERTDVPPTNEALHESVLARLPGPEQRLLRPLLAAYPSAMHSQTLADAAGYTAGAGAFNNPRGRLKTLGLIEYPQSGMVRARDLLFPL